MNFQKRLKRQMWRREMRVADLARWFKVPYTTVREWVLHGRVPGGANKEWFDRLLQKLENK